MKLALAGLASLALLASTSAFAIEGSTPVNPGMIPHFDHVFVIMLENHLKDQVIGNPAAPFLTQEAREAGQSRNFYGVGHPSLTNYLEVVGGSNFGITNDFPLNWAVFGPCHSNQYSNDCNGAVDSIFNQGQDVATPATAPSGGCNGQLSFTGAPTPHNCALRDYAAIMFTPKTIAHQLVEANMTFKDYQESLPTTGPRVDGVYYSDGTFSNLSPRSFFTSNVPTPVVSQLYVTDHNPFVFFADLQVGSNPLLSEAQIVDWTGVGGLYQDLATGSVPNLSFIVPNKCHDMHSSGGQSNTCTEQQPLIAQSDAAVKQVVTAIKSSTAWTTGNSVIVIVADEDDYSNSANRVPFIVDKNYGTPGFQSTTAYDHFSLLHTLEAGFGLPCLNNACDASAQLIDLFYH